MEPNTLSMLPGIEIAANMDTVYDSPYDMAHAATIAKRILFTNDSKTLRSMLTECFILTSQLFKEEDAAYFVYMCIQLRLETKLRKIEDREDANASQYEKAMYGRFAKSPTKYIPGAIILPSRGNGASRPDFFLEVNGLFSVAEFKANPFRYRDLYQLQEYMERFKATRGYAVAPSLICEAPENIIFVKMLPLWNTRAVTHELVASDIAQPTKEA